MQNKALRLHQCRTFQEMNQKVILQIWTFKCCEMKLISVRIYLFRLLQHQKHQNPVNILPHNQSQLVDRFNWIHHDNEKDVVFCNRCVEAVKMKMPLPKSSREKDSYQTFVVNGYSNWKKALQRFNSHERSEFHKSAVQMVTCATSEMSVDHHLNSQRKQ